MSYEAQNFDARVVVTDGTMRLPFGADTDELDADSLGLVEFYESLSGDTPAAQSAMKYLMSGCEVEGSFGEVEVAISAVNPLGPVGPTAREVGSEVLDNIELLGEPLVRRRIENLARIVALKRGLPDALFPVVTNAQERSLLLAHAIERRQDFKTRIGGRLVEIRFLDEPEEQRGDETGVREPRKPSPSSDSQSAAMRVER